MNGEVKFLCKIQKTNIFGGSGGQRGRVGGGGQGVDVNVFEKIQKKIGGGGLRWGSGWWGGGQGGCERNVGGRGRCGVWGM